MGINSRLDGLKNDILQVRAELKVLPMLDVADQQEQIDKLLGYMTVLAGEVDSIKCDNNQVKRDLEKALQGLL